MVCIGQRPSRRLPKGLDLPRADARAQWRGNSLALAIASVMSSRRKDLADTHASDPIRIHRRRHRHGPRHGAL